MPDSPTVSLSLLEKYLLQILERSNNLMLLVHMLEKLKFKETVAETFSYQCHHKERCMKKKKNLYFKEPEGCLSS